MTRSLNLYVLPEFESMNMNGHNHQWQSELLPCKFRFYIHSSLALLTHLTDTRQTVNIPQNVFSVRLCLRTRKLCLLKPTASQRAQAITTDIHTYPCNTPRQCKHGKTSVTKKSLKSHISFSMCSTAKN